MTEARREWFGEFSVLHRPAEDTARAVVHFAHATGFNANTYRPLLEQLDRSLDVYALDARGHGFTRAAVNPKSLRSWAPYRRDLRSFVETLSAPVVLAGHSMGATVSLEVAAELPGKVAGLVLADPVVVPPRRVLALAVARTLGVSNRLIPIAQMAARRRMEFPSKRAAVENFAGKGAFRTWPREWIEAYVEGGTVPDEQGGVRLSCDRDWESRTFAVSSVYPYRALRRVACPITLIARESGEPPFTRESREAWMKLRPDTRLLILEGASHFMPMERPEVMKREIEKLAADSSELG